MSDIDSGRRRLLILGGGFGGMYAAMELDRQLAGRTDLEVTLVNRENFFLFTPMLHEVAASDLDITHIVNPIRKLLRRVTFFHGEVSAIDLATRRVRLFHGAARHEHELSYDYLVIALGSTTNFYNIPGLREHALTMKSLGDAIHLRNHLIDLLEEADFECAIGRRDALLTVVVAGGGFAGTETVAAVSDFLREATKYYRHLGEDHVRVVLVHAGQLILPELGATLGAYAQRKLAARNVEIRVNVRVRAISKEAVQLSDGTTLAANTVVWTAGTSPSPLLSLLPCKREGGRLVVNEYMELLEWPGVWALGDCAAVPDHKSGRPYPTTAQHAMREGKRLARNILARLGGGAQEPFVFSTLGLLAALGRRTGVAQILGMNFSGFVAWFLWRSIYLSKLPRLEKKMRVALDWTLDLFFAKDLIHFMILRAPLLESQDEESQHASAATREG
jgi:NADH dehydrogenase